MTKEEAIKLIDDRMCFGRGKLSEHHQPVIDEYWQAGEMAIKALEVEPHWIPVTERLPEKSGEYLVTVKWVTGESDVDVYEYDARHKTWNDGESAGGERAVAWCNLPEPYKGVTE